MASTIIGVDPHKRSHTAVVLDADEAIAEQLRVPADRRQTDRLLAWAAQWPERIWAVENCNGLGRLLAQQLVRHGEAVIDVPATLTARTRRLSGHCGRKTDEFDARSVAIAAAGDRRLRRVQLEDFSVVLGLLVDRRWRLVSHQQRPSAGCTRFWPNSNREAQSWVCRSPRQPSCWDRCGQDRGRR